MNLKGLRYPQKKGSSCQFPIDYSLVPKVHLESLLKEAAPDMTDCMDGSSALDEIAGLEIVKPFEEASPGSEL